MELITKAITIQQPYAYAVAVGAKRIENRPRPSWVRGTLAVHAGMTWHAGGARDPRILELLRDHLWQWEIDNATIDPTRHRDLFPFGAVVGTVDLTGCHEHPDPPDAMCAEPWADRMYRSPLRQRTVRAWHLELWGARRLAEPVPVKGAQSVPWPMPADVARLVTERAALAVAS